MKKHRHLIESIPLVALATVVILMIPLIAMQFSDEVDWSLADFVIMGVLIFVTGSSYVALSRKMPNVVYKLAMAFAIGSAFLMVWANLAVGLIGSGPHVGNFMYIVVLSVIIIGFFLSRFSTRGMERAMYATVLSLLLLTIIALLANMQQYPDSSVMEIIGVNAFFATLFLISALLFRHASQEESRRINL